MKIKSLNLFHDIFQSIWEFYLENAIYLGSIQKYWNYSNFCNAWYAVAGHVTSFMHIYLHCRLFTYHSWEYSLLHFIFYPFPLYVHKNFKHYYNHGNHIVFKYVINDVGIGPLVLEQKIHQQRLCSLSKKVVIRHPFTVLFMIFNFKNDLLFIKILKILQQITCDITTNDDDFNVSYPVKL